MAWLVNTWYQAGWSDEIGRENHTARTILDIPMVIFRRSDGAIAAIFDRCPHRFAPISTGRVEGEAIRCGYHGLAFDDKGRCVANPHGAITQSLSVRSFPVLERHDAIWVWMGDPDLADATKIPDLSFIDETPQVARIHGYMPTLANYQLITDNIMDLSHADYLHPTTLGGMMTHASARTTEKDDSVFSEWTALDLPEPPPVFRASVPAPENVDIRITVLWTAPAVMKLSVSAVPAGIEPQEADVSWTLHNMTPETETSTHYFYCATRRSRVGDPEFSRLLKATLEQAFISEDKPVLEAQQRRLGTTDFQSLRPALLPIDAGAVRTRRILERLISLETSMHLAEQAPAA